MRGRGEATSKVYSANEKGTTMDNANNVIVEEPDKKSKKVEYDLDIPKTEMEWLNMSARGSIKTGLTT